MSVSETHPLTNTIQIVASDVLTTLPINVADTPLADGTMILRRELASQSTFPYNAHGRPITVPFPNALSGVFCVSTVFVDGLFPDGALTWQVRHQNVCGSSLVDSGVAFVFNDRRPSTTLRAQKARSCNTVRLAYGDHAIDEKLDGLFFNSSYSVIVPERIALEPSYRVRIVGHRVDGIRRAAVDDVTDVTDGMDVHDGQDGTGVTEVTGADQLDNVKITPFEYHMTWYTRDVRTLCLNLLTESLRFISVAPFSFSLILNGCRFGPFKSSASASASADANGDVATDGTSHWHMCTLHTIDTTGVTSHAHFRCVPELIRRRTLNFSRIDEQYLVLHEATADLQVTQYNYTLFDWPSLQPLHQA
jgi:hypothetical protein